MLYCYVLMYYAYLSPGSRESAKPRRATTEELGVQAPICLPFSPSLPGAAFLLLGTHGGAAASSGPGQCCRVSRARRLPNGAKPRAAQQGKRASLGECAELGCLSRSAAAPLTATRHSLVASFSRMSRCVGPACFCC